MDYLPDQRVCPRSTRRRSRLFRAAWPLSLAILLGTGCGTTLLGPEESGGGAGWTLSPPVTEPLVLTEEQQVGGFATVPTDSAIGLVLETLDAAGDSLPLPGRSLVVSSLIDGSRGGVLHAGRFTLTVPRGAFLGRANIACLLPDSTRMLCDLRLPPGIPNRFTVPVVLSLHTEGLGVDEKTLSIFWYDPSVKGWRALPTVANPNGRTVSTALTHFSRYLGGKAGW
jgi:hypothetical protein